LVRERCRMVATRLLESVMEAERDEFLACRPYERGSHRRGLRNGYESRWLETSWGSLRLRVPRVRQTVRPFRTRLFERHRRHWRDLEEAVRTWCAGGMSTRRVAAAVREVFGASVSAATVSRIVAEVDEEVRAFHARRFERGYRYLFLDAKYGYVRSRRRRGRKRQAVLLLAWGVTHGGREELVDFRVAPGEDEASWTAFLTDLEARGVRVQNRWGERLEMITTDGAAGLESALAMVYPGVPHQLCILHKLKNVGDNLRDRGHRRAILRQAKGIYRNVTSVPQARARLRRWVERWRDVEPEAVESLCAQFEDTLRYLWAPAPWRRRIRTNNPIERLIREFNRKFRQMGTFTDAASWERAAYLVWRRLEAAGYPHSCKNNFTRKS